LIHFPVRFALGAAVPLAVVGLAFGLWWIGDRLGPIGPFDRAAIGWAVVIPVWLGAPVAAGLAWRGLTRRATMLAAVVLGTAVGTAAAVLFWQAVANPDCEFGTIRTPIDWAIPSILVGAVVGSGLAASGLVASRLARHSAWRAAVIGAAVEMLTVFAAIIVAGALLMGGGCQRPPVS